MVSIAWIHGKKNLSPHFNSSKHSNICIRLTQPCLNLTFALSRLCQALPRTFLQDLLQPSLWICWWSDLQCLCLSPAKCSYSQSLWTNSFWLEQPPRWRHGIPTLEFWTRKVNSELTPASLLLDPIWYISGSEPCCHGRTVRFPPKMFAKLQD